MPPTKEGVRGLHRRDQGTGVNPPNPQIPGHSVPSLPAELPAQVLTECISLLQVNLLQLLLLFVLLFQFILISETRTGGAEHGLCPEVTAPADHHHQCDEREPLGRKPS